MCTVTYIPYNNRVLFSSNRDEDPGRPAALPPQEYLNHNKIYYPKDPSGGGTWIGLNDAGTFVVLLNGGLVKHQKKDWYRHSRGLVVTRILESPHPLEYWKDCNLDHIEPFTLIIFFNKKLYQLLWTGIEKCLFEPDVTKPHIWSSSTLYSVEVKKHRTEIFNRFINSNKDFHPSSLLNFLLTATKEDSQNGFVINRNELVKTASISIIEIGDEAAVYDYYDLNKRENNSIEISFIKNPALSNSSIFP